MQTVTLSLLLLLATVSSPVGAVEPARSASAGLELPPPPAGMRLLGEEERAKLLAQAELAPEEPEIAQGIDEDSAELEELEALEEVALDPGAQRSADVLGSLHRLGFANPLRQRMECALEESHLREDLGFHELPRITNLADFDVTQVQERYDIPIAMEPLVAQYIQFFQGPGRKWFRKWLSRSTRYIPMMQEILLSKGLPKDTVYLAMIESGFSERAYSWAHASGPWQFIPGTGKQYGLKQDFWVDERRDPVKSTHAAAAYLKQLHRELGHWHLAWAGYNTGGSRVRRLVAKLGSSDFWELSSGKGLAKETKHYVPKLIAAALVAKNPVAFGFQEHEFDYQAPLRYDTVELADATDLEVVARAAGSTVEELQTLNPELKRWCTPPASAKKPYRLRLPHGTQDTFAANYAKVPAHERLTFRVHRVKRGDTLSQIAMSYRSATEAIMRMNGLRSARALRLNAELIIPVPNRSAVAGRSDTVLERQVKRARSGGYVAPRVEEEQPAGAAVKAALASGTVKSETVGGRIRVSYAVAAGDTLWAISQRFDVSVEALRKWNGMTRRSRNLRIGTVLTLWPGAKAQLVRVP